ncbi:hypothetical protein JA9_003054 [Meyerozyma sp. JA9]|nr:hypothetical protein JA9_003054 [Meyerozyma sp. JA9]
MLLGRCLQARTFCQTHFRSIWRTPQDNYAINSKYGWFLVPKTHYAPRWTANAINQVIEENISEDSEKAGDLESLQKLVDEWAETVNIEEKPKVEKKTRADAKRQKDQALYRSQIREDVVRQADPTVKSKPTPRVKISSAGAVSFTHAWNYYLATHHKQYMQLGTKEARKIVASNWNLLSVDDKEHYRQEYADLLKQGKDIYKGEIVSKEEKLERTRKKKKK